MVTIGTQRRMRRGGMYIAVLAVSTEALRDVTICPSRSALHLPASLLETLVAQGYAFALPLTTSLENSG